MLKDYDCKRLKQVYDKLVLDHRSNTRAWYKTTYIAELEERRILNLRKAKLADATRNFLACKNKVPHKCSRKKLRELRKLMEAAYTAVVLQKNLHRAAVEMRDGWKIQHDDEVKTILAQRYAYFHCLSFKKQNKQ